MNAGIAAFRRRSPVRLECRALSSIATTATEYGMAVSKPMCKLLVMPVLLMIDGIQNARP
ncbi:hypothetical protein D3C80_2220810 [compost metagenome]